MTSRYVEATYEAGDFPPDLCVYCGELSEVVDHFVPVVWSNRIPTPARYRYTVPACYACNATAYDHAFTTLAEKAGYIAGHLRHKHRRILAAPLWSEAAVDELGPHLRGQVGRLQAQRLALVTRLEHLDAVANGLVG